jgi:hypothetical protein
VGILTKIHNLELGVSMVESAWEFDASACFVRRMGESPQELGVSSSSSSCPDIWELDSGDVAVVGRDVTELFADRLPPEVSVAHDERMVVVPGVTFVSAARHLPDKRRGGRS